ncbi:MAG: large conductance mechanosensitive channel protein MscL [Acidimicrobiales bacterium]
MVANRTGRRPGEAQPAQRPVARLHGPSKEFKAFILRGSVVELAVAVVIGLAFKAVIDAVVDLLTNLLAIPGKTDFGGLKFNIGGGTFRYGALINAVIAFLTVAAVIFFLIVRPLNALAERRKTGAEPEPQARPEDVLLLEEIRDLLRAQQAG